MRIDILTILPDLLSSPFSHSIIKRAIDKGLAEIHTHDIRTYSKNKHRKVDDYAYSVGAGMVMTIQPIADLIEKLKSEREYDAIIYTAPDGIPYEQKHANQFSSFNNIMILCGHYKGIDQRIRDHYITNEFSIGDYVLTGGELAAAVISDSIIRLIPGCLSDETSALSDSFQDGLLSCPVYTRPSDYNGWKVPDILLSGDERKINDWKMEKAIEKTKTVRPDLWEKLQ